MVNYIVLKSCWFGSHLDSKQTCAQATMLNPPEAPFGCGRSILFFPQPLLPKSSLGVGASLKQCLCRRKRKQPVHSNQTGVCQVCYGILSSLESSHRTVDVSMSRRCDTVCSGKACGIGYQPYNVHAHYRPEILLQEYSRSKEGELEE